MFGLRPNGKVALNFTASVRLVRTVEYPLKPYTTAANLTRHQRMHPSMAISCFYWKLLSISKRLKQTFETKLVDGLKESKLGFCC